MTRSSVSGGGGSTLSYGSNATQTADANAGGASATVSRSDHRHKGVASVISNTSNTLADPTINLASGANIAFGVDTATNTLTISSTASGGGAGVSYGSNATQVSDANAGGASTSVSRADHQHLGVAAIVSNTSNTMADPTVYLQAGTNVAFGVNAVTNTLTISATGGAGGGGSVSYASNSNDVSTASAAGASTLVSRADHVHRGFAVVTSSSSNTLTPATLNLRAGTGIALGLDASATNQTVTITNIGSGAGGGSTSDAVTVASGVGTIIIPGLAASPDIRVAGTNDDEFDTTDTSDPMTGWTTLGTPTTHNINSTAKSHYYVKQNAGGSGWVGIYKANPSTPFTVTAKLSGSKARANYNSAGLFVGETTPGQMLVLQRACNTAPGRLADELFTNPTTWSATYAYWDPYAVGPIWLRMVVTSSTDIAMYISMDGLAYMLHESGRNPGFTVGSVGLCAKAENATYDQEAFFDWIRFS